MKYYVFHKTYIGSTITTASSNADLSELAISEGQLSPVFSAEDTLYEALVDNAVTSFTITPAADTTATITVNGVNVKSGSTSQAIALNEGSNTITVVVTAQDGITQKKYTITATRAQSTLPVTLAAFNAYCKESTVEVTWKAVGETNIDKYVIERSNAGINYTEIGEMIAKGNSLTDVVYNWSDKQPLSGNNFYRLKTVDKDGTVKFSNVKSVNFSFSGQYLKIVLNPITNKTIRYTLGNIAAGKYRVSLYDNSGRKVFSTTIEHDGGNTIKTIYLNGLLGGGLYHLYFASGTLKLNEAVMIK